MEAIKVKLEGFLDLLKPSFEISLLRPVFFNLVNIYLLVLSKEAFKLIKNNRFT